MHRSARITGVAVLAFAASAQEGKTRTESRKIDGNLASSLVRAADAAPTRGEWGHWLRYFRGETHGTRDMVVLAVTLKPGQAPHPPHRHAEEEFMILAEGNGIWTLGDKELAAKEGDVIYAAPWTMHGIKSIGDGPLTYYMFKWSNKGVEPAKPPVMEGKAKQQLGPE